MLSNYVESVLRLCVIAGACPGIGKGGGPKSENLKAFFFAFQFFRGGPQLRKELRK